MLTSFPKIFALGESYIRNIFDNEIEITEKIDGSQFVFGKINGELYMRSKGAVLYKDNPEKMFSIAISYICSIEHLIPDNHVFYCEYLRNPKHNILAYERIPLNNLILFAIYDAKEKMFINQYDSIILYAKMLQIEAVPLIFQGKISADDISITLDKESILGGQKIEGFVVKNYHQPFLLGGQCIPLMAGKLVSESFKEKHKNDWKSEHSKTGKWDLFKHAHKTEARWLKAIQHLRDIGKLEQSPRDIGNLIKEIKQDIESEEKETIKEFLWREFGEELLRFSVSGFPEFYKKYLITNMEH